MKKGSYGRSKQISHSPVQKKWRFKGNPSLFTNITQLLVFYVNATDENIATVPTLSNPILRIPVSDMESKPDDFKEYDFSRLIQIFNVGCYFFGWADNTNTIVSNQILNSEWDGSEDPECLVYTTYLDINWLGGSLVGFRGVYIKNPSLSISTTDYDNINVLKISYGTPGSK